MLARGIGLRDSLQVRLKCKSWRWPHFLLWNDSFLLFKSPFQIATTKQPEKFWCFPFTVVPECKNYIPLIASDRNLLSTRGSKCDDNLKTGWYRFQGQAGRQLPTICPPVHRCNTDIPGWMNGNHPNVEDGIVKRQVCFHGYSKCCHRTTTIDVRNCGAYVVYRLTKVPTCRLRYCGIG